MKPAHRVPHLLSFVTALSVLILITGCGSSTSKSSSTSKPSAPKSKAQAGTLNWFLQTGDASWVKTLDPCCVTDSISIGNINMMDANLVKADYPSLKIIPDLATWKLSPDHKTYTFTIRSNAKFADGNPVTAEDAAWSITRSLLPATKSPVAATYLGHIVGATAVANKKATTVSGVKVINQHTLTITVDKPIAFFLGTLSYPTADVLEKKAMQGHQASTYLTNSCQANQHGAGPFKPVCVSNGNSTTSFYGSGHSPYITYVANPHYYGPKPKLKVYNPFMADLEANWREYLSGGVDATQVPVADISRAQKMKGYVQIGQLETDYITPNEGIAPFNNVNCRLAVAYAIDREGITSKLLHGIEGALYGVVPPGLISYFGKQADVPYYNPTKAKQYLAKCPGKLNGVALTYQSTGADIKHEYDAIRAELQAIGANVTIKPLTFNAWLNVVGQTMMATKTQITENLWIDDYPDPQDWLDNLLHTGANYNIGGFKDPQYDKLVDQANITFDPTERAALYQKAAKIAVQKGAWIGVGFAKGTYVINPRVHGMVATPSLVQPLHNDWSNVSVSAS